MEVDIVKLYYKFGYSDSAKNNQISFYTLRYKISNEEDVAIRAIGNGEIIDSSGNYTERGIALNNLIRLIGYMHSVSNHPQYGIVFLDPLPYTPEMAFDNMIDVANSYGFYTTKEYVLDPETGSNGNRRYFSSCADSNFSKVYGTGWYTASSGGSGNPVFQYRMWLRTSTTGRINIPVMFIVSNEKVYNATITLDIDFDQKTLRNVGWNVDGAVTDANKVLWALTEESQPIPTPPTPSDDPYSGGGTSGPGQGSATFDFSSEEVSVPTTPTLSSVDAGFLTLYRPSSSQLKSLAHYMWAGAFDYENLRKLFADPMDAIIGCHILPGTVDSPSVGSDTPLYIGNIPTTISMPPCTEQYFEVDCGTIQVLPKWGAYLDFSPYSKLSIYLPYIGIHQISPDDCMNGTIQVNYKVDVLSGSCVAFVYCKSSGSENGHVLYTFTGDCHCPVPITSGQYANAAIGLFNTVFGVGGAIASGITGSVGGAKEGITSAAKSIQSMIKPEITRSGSIGGSAGLMGIQKPFLILTIPKMCIPGEQNTYIGYPSFVTMTMSDLTGYTEIDVSHLNNMSCTQEEAEEIISLLGSGVIF